MWSLKQVLAAVGLRSSATLPKGQPGAPGYYAMKPNGMSQKKRRQRARWSK